MATVASCHEDHHRRSRSARRAQGPARRARIHSRQRAGAAGGGRAAGGRRPLADARRGRPARASGSPPSRPTRSATSRFAPSSSEAGADRRHEHGPRHAIGVARPARVRGARAGGRQRPAALEAHAHGETLISLDERAQRCSESMAPERGRRMPGTGVERARRFSRAVPSCPASAPRSPGERRRSRTRSPRRRDAGRRPGAAPPGSAPR